MIGDRLWLLLIVIGAIWVIGPERIEGKLAPAAMRAEIFKVERRNEGRSTAIWGQSSRLRAGCSFEALEWRLGRRDGQNVPVRVSTPGPVVRASEGRFLFGPWVLHGVPHHAVRGTFADVLHRCRWFAGADGKGGVSPPWRVRTPFWN